MFAYLRPERIALVLGVVVLLVLGIQLQGLPFIPNARFSDSALSHWPAAVHLRTSILSSGEFPLWQDTILAGQPFAANPLNKTAYPLQWLVLLFEPTAHLNLMIVLHLLLAGWGMWCWARALGLEAGPAAFSALAYALTPRALAHLGAGHLDLIYALAWWPWLMLAAHAFAGADRRWRAAVQVGLFGGLLVLADLRLGLFALVLAGAYAVWHARRSAGWLILTAGVGLLLTVSVTVPLLAWGPYLSRGDLDAAGAGVYSLEPGQLIGLVLSPRGGSPETLTYLGLVVLLLAVIGAMSALRQHVFWLAAIVIAMLYGLGINGPLWSVLIDLLPPLRWFRVPGRAWLVVVIAACVLAGYGLQVIMTLAARLQRGDTVSRMAVWRLAAAGFAGASFLCGGLTLFATGVDPFVGIGAALIGLLLGIVLLLVLYGRLNPQRLAMVLLVLLALDTAWNGTGWVEWRGPEHWLAQQDELAQALGDAGRIYSPNVAVEQQVAAAYELRLLGGVDPFQLRGIVEAIALASGIPGDGYSVVQPPLADIESDADLGQANCAAQPDLELLAQWDVSYIVSRCAIIGLEHTPLRIVNGTHVYANPSYTVPAALNSMGWPPDWPNLPDTTTVENLNNLTIAAAMVALLALVVVLIVLFRSAYHA